MPTPPRSVRISNTLWLAAMLKAEQNGETVTEVIRRALEQYISEERS